MNPTAIYSKTGKGVQEASGKTSNLSRADRAVLSAIDGKTSVSALYKKFDKTPPPKFDQLVDRLEREGYIREASPGVASAPRTSKPSAPVAAKPMDVVSDLDFTGVFTPVAGSPSVPKGPTVDLAAKARAEAERRAQEEALSYKARQAAAEAQAKVEAEARAREAASVRSRLEVEAKERAEAEAKFKAEQEIALRVAAEEKAKADKARVEVEAKEKAEAEVRRRKEEEERKRRDEERKRREEEEALRRKEEEERQLQAAILAEQEGNKDEAEAILAAPVSIPTVTVAPQVAKVEGVFTRTTWSAEVLDFGALVRYVAAHPEWESLLEPNTPNLNRLAISQHEALSIPGVRAVATTGRGTRS